MLTIGDPRPAHDCQGYSRREFLRIGALGCGGLSLAGLLQAQSRGAESSVLMAALESYQIYYLDPQPHNIVFPAD